MSVLTTVAISIVIILHVLFLVLEMFLWNTPFGRKTFGLKEEYARQSATLAANQGLYNGFLAAGLLWGLVSTDGFEILVFFLSCIIIAGIYGALTAKRSTYFYRPCLQLSQWPCLFYITKQPLINLTGIKL